MVEQEIYKRTISRTRALEIAFKALRKEKEKDLQTAATLFAIYSDPHNKVISATLDDINLLYENLQEMSTIAALYNLISEGKVVPFVDGNKEVVYSLTNSKGV